MEINELFKPTCTSAGAGGNTSLRDCRSSHKGQTAFPQEGTGPREGEREEAEGGVGERKEEGSLGRTSLNQGGSKGK